MNLNIDRLNMELPYSLGSRRHAIMQQLRVELMHFDWPSGEYDSLEIPPLQLSSKQTNIAIAKQIAAQIHQAAVKQPQRMNSKPFSPGGRS